MRAGHADRTQQADFAGALGDGQCQGVRDSHERDDDRQAEQRVDEGQQLVEELGLVRLVLRAIEYLDSWVGLRGLLDRGERGCLARRPGAS